MRVEFVRRIRDIVPFSSIDALIAAMKEDERLGREMLRRDRAARRAARSGAAAGGFTGRAR